MGLIADLFVDVVWLFFQRGLKELCLEKFLEYAKTGDIGPEIKLKLIGALV